MVETGTLAEVAVEVSANLLPLEQGLAKAKVQTQAAERDLQKLSKATGQTTEEAMKLEREYRQLARAYDPLHAAQIRHIEDLRKIDRLQKAGFLNARDADRWRGAAVVALDKETAATNRLGKATGSATLFMRGFIGAVGVGLATQLATAATNSLKATAAIGDLSKAAGLSTTQFQEWRGVAMQLGIETKTIDSAMSEFAENVRQGAAGAEREAKAFKLLGVNLKDGSGNAKDMNTILLETIDRLGQVHNPLQRGAALALLFGEAAGPQMAKLIDAGVPEINNLREAVHDLGLVMSEEEIQKADETAKKLDQVSTVLSHNFASTVVENADGILKLANALSVVTGAVINFLGSNPGLAVALLGALAGGVVGGVPGALIGGAGAYGIYRANQTENPISRKEEIEFQRHNLAVYQAELRQKRNTGQGVKQSELDRLNRMTGKLNQLIGGPATAAPTSGGIDLSGLFDRKTGGRKGGGAKAKKEPDNVFDREELQAQQERLRLLRASTVDLTKRHDIEQQLIDISLKEQYDQIDRMVRQGRLTVAEGEQLKKQEEANAQLERAAATREMQVGLLEQQARRAEEMLDVENQLLQASMALARTDKERHEIDASILRNKQQQELLEIDKQIAIARQLNDEQRIADLTEIRRKTIERQGVETKGLAVEQLTGLAKFKNELPATVQEINEAIDRIRFDKLMENLQRAAQFADDIGDAFARAATRLANFEKPIDVVKGLLQDLAQTLTETFIAQPIRDLAKRAIGVPMAKAAFGDKLTGPDALTVEQMNMALDLATGNLNALSAAAASASVAMGGAAGASEAADQLGTSAQLAGTGLANLDPQLASFGNGLMSILQRFMGGGTGGGLGSLLKLGMSALGSAFGGGGLGGGEIEVASTGSIANTKLDWSGIIPGYAGGGRIWGRGTGRSDDNLIWASTGEHMINARAADTFRPLLDGINSGLIPDMPSLARVLKRQEGNDDRDWRRIDARTLGGLAGAFNQNFYIQTKDADSFMRSERQIRDMGRRRLSSR